MITKCPVCGAPIENGKCTYCTYNVPGGAQTNRYSQARPEGYRNPPPVQREVVRFVTQPVYIKPKSDKSKAVAFLLCLFLGFCGAHHFYAGKVLMAILYLFTGGLFGIGWFIDLIMILCGAFKDSKGLPISK